MPSAIYGHCRAAPPPFCLAPTFKPLAPCTRRAAWAFPCRKKSRYWASIASKKVNSCSLLYPRSRCRRGKSAGRPPTGLWISSRGEIRRPRNRWQLFRLNTREPGQACLNPAPAPVGSDQFISADRPCSMARARSAPGITILTNDSKKYSCFTYVFS